VIKFHYFNYPPTDIGRHKAVSSFCHVYSDTGDVAELLNWGRENGFLPRWLMRANDGWPHFDAFSGRLRRCGSGSPGRELVQAMRNYRRAKEVRT
jgi:hypothetical protein